MRRAYVPNRKHRSGFTERQRIKQGSFFSTTKLPRPHLEKPLNLAYFCLPTQTKTYPKNNNKKLVSIRVKAPRLMVGVESFHLGAGRKGFHPSSDPCRTSSGGARCAVPFSQRPESAQPKPTETLSFVFICVDCKVRAPEFEDSSRKRLPSNVIFY